MSRGWWCLLAALALATPANAQVSWTVTPYGSGEVAIGQCVGLGVIVVDDATGTTAMSPGGRGVSLMDFEYAFAGTPPPGFVWKSGRPTSRAVCACSDAVPGSAVAVTLSYPAQDLDPRHRVPGVALSRTLALAAVPGTGTDYTVGCPVPTSATAASAVGSPAGQALPTTPSSGSPTFVPANPGGFTASEVGGGQVELAWNAVPGVAYYVLLGPGIPEGGTQVRGATRYTTAALASGSHTWAVASYYEPGPTSSPAADFPRATLQMGPAAPGAAPASSAASSGRYLVTMTALRALMHTADDMLQRDGKGDEIYAAAYVRRFDRRSGQIVEFTNRRTQTYGDVNGFVNERIKTGSRSELGGIQAGDPVPNGAMRTDRFNPAQASTFPMLIWEGVLTDGADALAISPSIWEADGDGGTYGKWVTRQQAAMSSLYQYQPLHEQILQRRFSPVVVGTVDADADQAAGIATAAATTVALQLVFPIMGAEALLFGDRRDQPIGMVWSGVDAFELPNTVVLLTREIIEAALAQPAPGMLPLIPSIPQAGFFAVLKPGIMVLRFAQADGPIYLMYVQVERVP